MTADKNTADENYYGLHQWFNPYDADIFQAIFHSFEAEFANAISSSKWRKKMYVYEKIYVFKI